MAHRRIAWACRWKPIGNAFKNALLESIDRWGNSDGHGFFCESPKLTAALQSHRQIGSEAFDTATPGPIGITTEIHSENHDRRGKPLNARLNRWNFRSFVFLC